MEKKEKTLEGVSVIVLTRNRIAYVKRLFDSLCKELQTFDKQTEVIVVDHSKPRNSTQIAEMCIKNGFLFKYLARSISEARNYGVMFAKFPIILFIDSDCEVVQGILNEHFLSYTEDRIGGTIGLTNFTGEKNWVWKAIEKTSFLTGFSFAQSMDYTFWGPCSNISLRKDVIIEVGGFRTEFPFDYSGEDVDIGLRINEAGYKIKCNPKAIVNHTRETWSRFWDFTMKIFRWGRTDYHILKMHPDLSSIDFPKFTTIFLLLSVISLLLALIGFGWKAIELIIIWLTFTPLLEAFLKSYKSSFADFVYTYLSFWLKLVFELGSTLESLRRGSLSMLYRKLKYGNGQLIYEWDGKMVQGWSHFIIFLVFLFILLLG